jgi:hypothetical protein
MAPNRVDPNKKQAKSLNNQVEEDTFFVIQCQEVLTTFQVKQQWIMS